MPTRERYSKWPAISSLLRLTTVRALKLNCPCFFNHSQTAVAIVTDESMKLLFQNGHGEVYRRVINWLSSPVEDLLVSGVLAVVNFARAGKSVR